MNGKGILIVEDENIVALDMKMRLESLGYQVLDVVDTGPAALAFLGSRLPDLILMDIKLKGNSDGIETARIARERVDVPIIFVTAFTDENTLERAKLASPYGYIVKPFHERELRIAIELALYKFQYELSMRHAKELAEEANRMKGEFLANVSHELKTPLNSVIGFTELSLDRAADEEQREYLSTVLRSARSLVTLIDSILDFSRLENGKLSPVFAAFSIDSLLGECVEFLSIGAASKGLEVSFRRDPLLPEFIVCDRDRLRQILMNLADNAVKFTERGGIRLCAELAPQPAHRHGSEEYGEPTGRGVSTGKPILLRLVMADTGMGMAPEKVERAFDRFTQLDGSSTRLVGGTGIGLAIVAKSVDLLEGSISVKSSPGQGSRFEVLLPMDVDENAAPKDPVPLRGQHFVYLGFSEEASSDLSELLEALGAEVSRVGSLEEIVPRKRAWVVLGDEGVNAREDSLRVLQGRIIVSCRPGFAGRGSLRAQGCAIVPSPVRVRPLLDAIEALGKEGGLGRDGASRQSIELGRQPKPLHKEPVAKDEVESVDKGREELGQFVQCLEAALAARNAEKAERDSKHFRDIFQAMEAPVCAKLAFSSLLLSRKGDWDGIGALVKKGKRLMEAAHVQTD